LEDAKVDLCGLLGEIDIGELEGCLIRHGLIDRGADHRLILGDVDTDIDPRDGEADHLVDASGECTELSRLPRIVLDTDAVSHILLQLRLELEL
jgi:hypothetical protein